MNIKTEGNGLLILVRTGNEGNGKETTLQKMGKKDKTNFYYLILWIP